MNGWLINQYFRFSVALGGRRLWEGMLKRANLPERFDPLFDTCGYQQFLLMTAGAAELSRRKASGLLIEFGHHLAGELVSLAVLVGGNPKGVDPAALLDRAVREWLPELRSLNPAVDLSGIESEWVEADELLLAYRSEWKLCLILRGVIEGVVERGGGEAEVVEESCMLHGDPRCEFHLRTFAGRVEASAVAISSSGEPAFTDGEVIRVFAEYQGVPIVYDGIVRSVTAGGLVLRTSPNVLSAVAERPELTIGRIASPGGFVGRIEKVDHARELVHVGALRPTDGVVGLRNELRVSVREKVSASVAVGGSRVEGWLRDLSASGAAVWVSEWEVEGDGRQRVELAFPLAIRQGMAADGRHREARVVGVRVPASVVGIHPRDGGWLLRLRFVKGAGAGRGEIEHYIMQRQVEALRQLKKVAPVLGPREGGRRDVG